MDPRWTTLLQEARAAHGATPELRDFCAFPDALRDQPGDPRPDPLAVTLQDAPGDTSARWQGFRDAACAAGPIARWRDTYRHTAIGADLHRHFGCYELLGQDAPYGTEEMRGFLVYQRPGYHYPAHHHPAEEIYLVVAGEAEFHLDGHASRRLGPGGTVFHPSGVAHALTTHDSPVLAWVLWRGEMDRRPVFSDPALQGEAQA